MRLSLNLFPLVAIAILARATATLASTVKCSVEVIPTTCPKGQYCQAGKTSSYCNKKLTGGAQCDKDEACVSNICFVAKKTASGKLGKRTCAPVPTINYPLKARCTESEQCSSTFCSEGFCETPAPSGEKCKKDAGCAGETKCLKKAETFIVYDKAGKKSTKKLSPGHCSYITNLGLGMGCKSNDNCYKEKFECSKNTNKCIAAIVPLLAYKVTCSANSQCSSTRCVDDICGCNSDGSDCKSAEYCSDLALCQAKQPYGKDCSSNTGCLSDSCVAYVGVERRGASPFDKVCGCIAGADCPAYNICDTDQICKLPNYPYLHECEADFQCNSLTCRGDSTCGCLADSDCNSSGEWCDESSTCSPKQVIGTTCSFDQACQSNICIDKDKNTGYCGCTTDDECLSFGYAVCQSGTGYCTA